MNKFYMNGKLIHNASDHNTKRCEVEKWVFLPHSDFERLKANPYQEHEAITAARDLMYEDKNDELLHELSGQASDGWGEGFEQRDIHTSEGDIYVSFYDTCGAWELMTEEEVKAAPESPLEDVGMRM